MGVPTGYVHGVLSFVNRYWHECVLGALFSVISDNSNSGVSLAIQDV